MKGLEKGEATRSGILAWKIPWMEEPGRLQSMADPSSKATLWGKAQHEGALPLPCIVRNLGLRGKAGGGARVTAQG